MIPFLFLMLLVEPSTKPVSEPTIIELKAEIRLLKAKLNKQQVDCQIALSPEFRIVSDEVSIAQKELDAIKKSEVAKAP